ncbi:Ty1/Copia family ribonuclease HI [Phanerochaete sordida]|uniref:Ty1/Copia family ribonuclease HI n=1 Tax=Phanerochaete sordida TaxID=48140 RepID=A0A9P3GQR3_9APHY|nr:Ty1/Copia family ribonuclease HI [Phanerochaete sordida]
MYAALGTRPDIAFAVNRLSQYQSNPSTTHLAAAHRVLRYLRGTSHLRLCLGHDDQYEDDLVSFTDADFAGDKDNSVSTSGWAYLLGRGAVSWSSRKQRSVAGDTFGAEYFAANEAVKQLKWLEIFAEQIEHPLNKPVSLHCDNKSAVDASRAPNVKHRTKHVRVHAHSVHESFVNGLVELVRIPGVDNPADVLTKPLPAEAHARHIATLGLVPYRLAKGEC